MALELNYQLTTTMLNFSKLSKESNQIITQNLLMGYNTFKIF
jgi:hypothetical protein